MKIQTYNARRARAFGKKYTWVNRLILMRSDPHTHTELQFSDSYGNISFSATMHDKCKSARFKEILYSHPERWDTIDVPMSREDEDVAWEAAKELDDTPYDLIGLLSHATPLKIIKPHRKKVWCSEACTKVLVAALPAFGNFLENIGMPQELTPVQLDWLARYYFR